MFNRLVTQRITPAVQQKNDIAALSGLRTKSLEQRILLVHQSGLQTLNTKIAELSSKIVEPVTASVDSIKNDPEILKLKEQCDIQSKLLNEYEQKVVSLVEYIKRLEQGLETVKELLTNKTNTADTLDAVPEFDEPAQEATEEAAEEANPEEEKAEEEKVEEVTVESVKEEGEVAKESVSLEIIDEEAV